MDSLYRLPIVVYGKENRVHSKIDVHDFHFVLEKSKHYLLYE